MKPAECVPKSTQINLYLIHFNMCYRKLEFDKKPIALCLRDGSK